MFRRLVVPLTAIAALLALFAVVSPTGAKGDSRSTSDKHYVDENVTIDQPVLGTVQLYGGTLMLREVIAGDLLVIGGKVTFAGRGRDRAFLIQVKISRVRSISRICERPADRFEAAAGFGAKFLGGAHAFGSLSNPPFEFRDLDRDLFQMVRAPRAESGSHRQLTMP